MQWSVLRLGFKIDLEDTPLFVFMGTSSGTASNQQARNKELSGSGGCFSCFSISHCACHCSPHPSPDIRLWLPCPSMWAEYPHLLGRLQSSRSGRGGTQLPGLSRSWGGLSLSVYRWPLLHVPALLCAPGQKIPLVTHPVYQFHSFRASA